MRTYIINIALALASSGLAQETATEEPGVATTPGTSAKAGTDATTESEEAAGPSDQETTGREAYPLPVRCRTQGDIALTFDDGPGLFTSDILDALNAKGVKATFHVVSTMLMNEELIGLMKGALADGHNIGLRFDPAITDTELSKLSLESFHNKLISESNIIHQHLGVFPRLLRMPYQFQYLDHSYHELVTRLGFIVTGWTIDSKDYVREMNVEDLVEVAYEPMVLVAEESMEDADPVHESFIVLHRDIFDIAPVVEAGIQLVEDEGVGRLRFVTLGECLHVDNVYKRDVQGLHGFVGANGNPVETSRPQDTEEDVEEIPEKEEEYSDESYPEPEPLPEPETELEVGEEGNGDLTHNLTDGSNGMPKMFSAFVAGGLVALFA